MDPRAPLRVGVLVESLRQPRWVRTVVENVGGCSFATLSLIVSYGSAPGSSASSTSSFSGPRGLLYSMYRAVDARRNTAVPDAFEMVEMDDVIGDCPRVFVTARRRDERFTLGDEDIDLLSEYQLDVGIMIGDADLKGRAWEIAKYGVWVHRHGSGPAGADLADFWDLYEREAVIPSRLAALDGDSEEKTLYRSYAANDRFSLRAMRNNYYWKSTGFVERKLRDVYTRGAAGLEPDAIDDTARPSTTTRARDVPTNSQVVKFLLREGRRWATTRAHDKLVREQWILSYRLADEVVPLEDVGRRFVRMMPPPDRFWADPFPVRVGDRFFIFIEELLYEHPKGFLSVVEMDDQGSWTRPTPILETEHHLSYPFVFEWQGERYMIPECGDSGRVTLYRAHSFPFDWKPEAVLLDGVRAVDPTLHRIGSRWWLYVNIAVEGARMTDELHLFHADRPQGPWTPHARNPVKSDVRSARPAGRLFEQDGMLFRPAQDSSIRPGNSIALNVVERITPTEYSERTVGRIEANWEAGLTSTHTINHLPGLTVVDCRVRRWKYGTQSVIDEV